MSVLVLVVEVFVGIVNVLGGHPGEKKERLKRVQSGRMILIT